MLAIETLVVGELSVNCYLAWDRESGRGIIIDPAGDRAAVSGAVARSGAVFERLVCTHGHFDHVPDQRLREESGVPLFVHRLAAPVLARAAEYHEMVLGVPAGAPPPEPDGFLEEGQVLAVGGVPLTVWHTPGHSPGSICLVGAGVVFSGDTLFQRGVGRTDLGGGSEEKLQASLRRLLDLPPETRVYPGHGPATDIGAERQALAGYLAR